eukprot:4048869-Prymnesium_polylepis.1
MPRDSIRRTHATCVRRRARVVIRVVHRLPAAEGTAPCGCAAVSCKPFELRPATAAGGRGAQAGLPKAGAP